jgi:hypothetical protein
LGHVSNLLFAIAKIPGIEESMIAKTPAGFYCPEWDGVEVIKPGTTPDGNPLFCRMRIKDICPKSSNQSAADHRRVKQRSPTVASLTQTTASPMI